MSGTDEFVDKLVAAYRSTDPDLTVDIAAIRAGAARRRHVRPIGLIAAAAAVAGVAFAGWQVARPDSGGSGPLPTRTFAASELRTSDTAKDWASTADVVLVATVVSEKVGKVSPLDDGTDDAFVGRSVTVSVQDTVWTPGKVEAPSELTVAAPGWIQHDGELRARLTYELGPRLELGHTYVLALLKDRCGNSWDVLGSGGALPYDHGSVGHGESRGILVAEDDPEHTVLARQFAGHRASDLGAFLARLLESGQATRQAPAC